MFASIQSYDVENTRKKDKGKANTQEKNTGKVVSDQSEAYRQQRTSMIWYCRYTVTTKVNFIRVGEKLHTA